MMVDSKEYISLTDLARYANSEEPKIPIYAWMRSKDVISYLGLWESINNENFKGVEFDTFKSEAGNNGGTYARSDIAFEFASWLSLKFKLYLITEFQRLKKKEASQEKMD